MIGREKAQLFCCTHMDPIMLQKRSTQVSKLEDSDNSTISKPAMMSEAQRTSGRMKDNRDEGQKPQISKRKLQSRDSPD